MAFSLMTLKEQNEIIYQHIDFCIANFDLNERQVEVLNLAKRYLPTMSKSRNIEESKEMIELEMKVEKYFKESELSPQINSLIFDSMITSMEGVTINQNESGNLTKLGKCGCSQSSDWCSTFTSGNPGKCAGDCELATSKGCGTFWNYPCDANCTLFAE